MGSPEADKELKRLLSAADKARAKGEVALASYLSAEAAQILTDAGKVSEAIELYVVAREYAPAAELWEKQQNYQQAARFWFRAGDLGRAAQAHLKIGEDVTAAELFERAKDFVSAGEIYERRGDFMRAGALYEKGKAEDRAAELFARLIASNEPAIADDMDELCKRTGLLLLRLGRTADAIRLLRHGNQLFQAGKQLVLEEKFEAAIDLLEAAGEIGLAAEACKRAGQDERAAVMLAQQAEREGNKSAAGAYYAQAGQYAASIRCYEAAGDLLNAAVICERAGHMVDASQFYEKLGLYEDARRCYRAGGEHGAIESLDEKQLEEAEEAPVIGDVLPEEIYPAAARLVAAARSGELSRYDEAIDLLLKLGPNDQDFAVGRRLLSACYQETGDPDRARQILDPLPALRNVVLTSNSIIGSTLRGRFRIEAIIGTGSQAIVYRARDLQQDKLIAIKVATAPLDDNDDDLERFMREVRIAARVHHHNCVSVYDFGQEHGLTFMAMELVEGDNLGRVLQNGPLDPARSVRIARQVADALSAVHHEGIVHRDVKPANIMLGKDDEVRLMDFGIAKVMGEETTAGMMIGTISYMSPEAASGKPLDSRADVFSLGVLLFEMLAGKRPWGSDLASLARRGSEPPPALPDELMLPEIVADAVLKCMQPLPSERYGTMEQLIADLDVALDVLDVEDDDSAY